MYSAVRSNSSAAGTGRGLPWSTSRCSDSIFSSSAAAASAASVSSPCRLGGTSPRYL
jgi:hypothetical protein